MLAAAAASGKSTSRQVDECGVDLLRPVPVAINGQRQEGLRRLGRRRATERHRPGTDATAVALLIGRVEQHGSWQASKTRPSASRSVTEPSSSADSVRSPASRLNEIRLSDVRLRAGQERLEAVGARVHAERHPGSEQVSVVDVKPVFAHDWGTCRFAHSNWRQTNRQLPRVKPDQWAFCIYVAHGNRDRRSVSHRGVCILLVESKVYRLPFGRIDWQVVNRTAEGLRGELAVIVLVRP